MLGTVEGQRTHWEGVLRCEVAHALSQVGKEWGDPEVAGPLGNYPAVLARLRALLARHQGHRALEIGSYGGKWTQYLLPGAQRVTCVDLFAYFGAVLRARFADPRILFGTTEGGDLFCAASGCVDVAFSMDTLRRAPLHLLDGYLSELARVLSPDGVALLHLPWRDSAGSVARGFTDLSSQWLEESCAANGLQLLSVDAEVVVHGAMVEVGHA